MYSVIYPLLFTFGISWAFQFRGSCPEPSPARLPENFTSEKVNSENFRFYPLLGIPNYMHISKFFLDINIDNYKLFSLYLHVDIDRKNFGLYLKSLKKSYYHINIFEQKPDDDQIFQVFSTVYFIPGQSHAVQPTNCNSREEVRLWYDNQFLLFWSCINGELFYDEAFLVIELKQVDGDNLDEYTNRLFDLKPIAKKYISPQLMDHINWQPKEMVTPVPVVNCLTLLPTNFSVFDLPRQNTISKNNRQNVKPNIELLPILIIVVTVVVLIIIGTLVVLKNSNDVIL